MSLALLSGILPYEAKLLVQQEADPKGELSSKVPGVQAYFGLQFTIMTVGCSTECIHERTHIYIYIYVCMYMYMYMHMHTYMHMYIDLHGCTLAHLMLVFVPLRVLLALHPILAIPIPPWANQSTIIIGKLAVLLRPRQLIPPSSQGLPRGPPGSFRHAELEFGH